MVAEALAGLASAPIDWSWQAGPSWAVLLLGGFALVALAGVCKRP